jgi:hypothetical protein
LRCSGFGINWGSGFFQCIDSTNPLREQLIFALDERSAAMLNVQFEAGAVKKSYLALVRGWLEGSGRIDYPLRRETDRYTRQRSEVLQDAVTDWWSVATGGYPHAVGRYSEARYSLLRLAPLTGRNINFGGTSRICGIRSWETLATEMARITDSFASSGESVG